MASLLLDSTALLQAEKFRSGPGSGRADAFIMIYHPPMDSYGNGGLCDDQTHPRRFV